MDFEDIEKLLRAEEFDKKRTGRGVYGRASRTGRGKGYMPYELLRGKELEDYMGASEVTTYYIDKEGKRIESDANEDSSADSEG